MHKAKIRPKKGKRIEYWVDHKEYDKPEERQHHTGTVERIVPEGFMPSRYTVISDTGEKHDCVWSYQFIGYA